MKKILLLVIGIILFFSCEQKAPQQREREKYEYYSEKYQKLHPRPIVFSADEMVKAINMIFGIDEHLAQAFIKRTESGGAYIDATALLFNLDGRQAEIIDKMTGKVSNKNSLNYSFTVTDAIMKTYSKM